MKQTYRGAISFTNPFLSPPDIKRGVVLTCIDSEPDGLRVEAAFRMGFCDYRFHARRDDGIWRGRFDFHYCDRYNRVRTGGSDSVEGNAVQNVLFSRNGDKATLECMWVEEGTEFHAKYEGTLVTSGQ